MPIPGARPLRGFDLMPIPGPSGYVEYDMGAPRRQFDVSSAGWNQEAMRRAIEGLLRQMDGMASARNTKKRTRKR